MVELIDKNRLLNPGYTDFFDEPIKIDVFTREAIEAQPVIQAIPIKWIEQYVRNHFTFADWYGGFIKGISDLMEDWEKENG